MPPLHVFVRIPVAQFLMSWLLTDGRFRIYAINGMAVEGVHH